jgi:hypothetical protein
VSPLGQGAVGDTDLHRVVRSVEVVRLDTIRGIRDRVVQFGGPDRRTGGQDAQSAVNRLRQLNPRGQAGRDYLSAVSLSIYQRTLDQRHFEFRGPAKSVEEARIDEAGEPRARKAWKGKERRLRYAPSYTGRA